MVKGLVIRRNSCLAWLSNEVLQEVRGWGMLKVTKELKDVNVEGEEELFWLVQERVTRSWGGTKKGKS